MKSFLICVAALGMVLAGFRCSELANPQIENEMPREIAVTEISLATPREYVTRGEPLVLQLSGIKRIFSCSELSLAFFKTDSGSLQPSCQEILPNSPTACPLTPPEGFDTLVHLDLQEFEIEGSRLRLGNSLGEPQFEKILVGQPHIDTLLSYALIDSNLTLDSLENDLYAYIDTIRFPCSEQLSYGAVCLNSTADNLFVKLVFISGWNDPDCQEPRFFSPSNNYIQWIEDKGVSCMDTLELVDH